MITEISLQDINHGSTLHSHGTKVPRKWIDLNCVYNNDNNNDTVLNLSNKVPTFRSRHVVIKLFIPILPKKCFTCIKLNSVTQETVNEILVKCNLEAFLTTIFDIKLILNMSIPILT